MVCREDFEFLPPLRVFPPVSLCEKPVSEVRALLVATNRKEKPRNLTVEEAGESLRRYWCSNFTGCFEAKVCCSQ